MKINPHNSSNPLSPVTSHYSSTTSTRFLLFPMWFSSKNFLICTSEIGKRTLEIAASHHETSATFIVVCKCRNRLCGHSSGIRGMCQASQSNGSMTAVISEVADMPRHPSTRTPSKAGFWEGTTPARNSLLSAEIRLCSELHVLVFKSQIAYGDSRVLLRAPSYFQHC